MLSTRVAPAQMDLPLTRYTRCVHRTRIRRFFAKRKIGGESRRFVNFQEFLNRIARWCLRGISRWSIKRSLVWRSKFARRRFSGAAGGGFRDAGRPLDLGRSIMGLYTGSLNLERSLSVRSTGKFHRFTGRLGTGSFIPVFLSNCRDNYQEIC